MKKIPGSSWIGLDVDADPPRVACARRVGFSGKIETTIGGLETAQARADGSRTIVALPSSSLFAERLALPPRSSDEIVKGQLDVRLPVPVEECLVLSSLSSPRSSSVMAYAVTKEAFGKFIDFFRSRFGFCPERVVPAAEVLWHRISSILVDEAGCAIHLHASGTAWTLLAGDLHGLAATLTIPPGDIASIARNSAILALRQKREIVSFTLSGEKADDKLVGAIQDAMPSLDCTVRPVNGPRDFLAIALAEEGALRDLDRRGNFHDEGVLHDGAFRRLLARAACASLFLLSLGLVALVCSAVRYGHARADLAAADDSLTTVAYELAGRSLPVRGPAALEMARNEFDQRLNPTVEAHGDTFLFDSIAIPLELALTRSLTFSSIQIDDRMARFSGKALSDDELSIWKRRAAEAGLALAVETSPSEDGVGLLFSATQFAQGGAR